MKLTETICKKCSDSFGVSEWEDHTDICPRCKEAIAKSAMVEPVSQSSSIWTIAVIAVGSIVASGLAGIAMSWM